MENLKFRPRNKNQSDEILSVLDFLYITTKVYAYIKIIWANPKLHNAYSTGQQNLNYSMWPKSYHLVYPRDGPMYYASTHVFNALSGTQVS